MTFDPEYITDTRVSDAMKIARSAVIIGTARLADDAIVAQGAVIRSLLGSVEIGSGSVVLENSVAIGSPTMSVKVGRRTAFGHRCLIIGATVGNLCEIGNASILMPGATIGDRVFLGEGTVVPTGMALPNDVVAVGRPARIVRSASADDYARLTELRGGDFALGTSSFIIVNTKQEALPMGQYYEYQGIVPTIAESATVFPTAEITGDVVIGERTVIAPGVKIIGDSHGPVRIGNDVQILENAVLHLLPHNDLVIDDAVIVGPGAMIHGCRIGSGSVIEPGAIVSDFSQLGENCVVRAGAVVKQRSKFPAGSEIDGFPAVMTSQLAEAPVVPGWALRAEEFPRPGGQANRVTSRRHIAQASSSSGSSLPSWRVDIHAGSHILVADEPVLSGGGGAGPSPFGLVMSGLAACTAMTLRMYANRKGWDLRHIHVDIRYDLDEGGNTEIHRTVTVPNDLEPAQRERLAEIAERTPVTLAIRNGTRISTVFASRDEDFEPTQGPTVS